MTCQYEGGYFMFNDPIVRGYGANGHTARDLSQLSNYTVEAINYIQDTPWMTNPFVLDVSKALFEKGHNATITNRSGIEEVVLRVSEPMNPRLYDKAFYDLPKDDWDMMSREQKQAFKEKRARLLKKFEEELGVYRATQRVMAVAEEMAEFDTFYFPHNLDFRTRIYPIPNDLTPQANDFAKGLLRFSRPTRIGQQGLFWMGVMVATHFGEDKLSMKERFIFAEDLYFEGDIQSWVDDPLVNRGWLNADKPFQFLAIAYEWVWAHRQDDPTLFLSYLPGNLDGSCNGAQHLSVLARDKAGATLTNCTSENTRHDLYMTVADRVWEKVQKDIMKGEKVALEWQAKMSHPSDRRKVVKRAVMTVPYGVTEYGVAEFMLKDNHVASDSENRWDSAKYMRDMIWASIEETLTAGRAIQTWISDCASRCAEAGVPLSWDTPAGSKVTQAYREVIATRIQSFNSRFYIYEEPEEDEDDATFAARLPMNEKKMATSAPPNVIHSFDASHLQITVCRMADAGIQDFSMIHDSFGCPLAYVGLMRDILRQSFVDMYQDNFLLTFKESVERYSGLTMPEPPELGDFDIQEVLNSEFFFS